MQISHLAQRDDCPGRQPGFWPFHWSDHKHLQGNLEEAMTGISIRSLTVQYGAGAHILDSLSLEIREGEIMALLGASGSGKSTLLKTLARLIEPSSGSIRFSDPTSLARQGDLSYVFQDPTLLPWRTVEENVRLPLELGKSLGVSDTLSLPERSRCIAETLTSVGLERPVHRRFPRELSGGMKMRASIARALITDPTVLLLDEPFAALDDLLRTRMNELVLELWQQKRRTIVFVTHNIAEAAYLSHRVGLLGNGKISKILENPLPWPRSSKLRTAQEFASFYGRISGALAEVAG
jgi:NitT/TauT family transport system ATP-binding protein